MGLFFIPKTYKSRAANVDFFLENAAKKNFYIVLAGCRCFQRKKIELQFRAVSNRQKKCDKIQVFI